MTETAPAEIADCGLHRLVTLLLGYSLEETKHTGYAEIA